MKYIAHYQSPLGGALLAADESGLTGLWFEGQKYFASRLESGHTERNMPVFDRTRKWLDIYFSGREPEFTPPVHMIGTPFQISVWKLLCRIPYGKTVTYGEIAAQIAVQRGLSSMSAQAVGGAVGRNHISLIVPCHRVVGTDKSLTGYAGGLERKKRLLLLERADI